MIKPDYCKYCGSTKLTFIKDNLVFDPDSELEGKVDSWTCTDCKTIHVDNRDFSFIQREIDNNKLIQSTDCNIAIN